MIVIQEGEGIPGIIELGDSLRQVVSVLGRPEVNYIDTTQGVKLYWHQWPDKGIGCAEFDGKIVRISFNLSVFFGKTARGLPTDAKCRDIIRIYGTPEFTFKPSFFADRETLGYSSIGMFFRCQGENIHTIELRGRHRNFILIAGCLTGAFFSTLGLIAWISKPKSAMNV